MLHPVVLSLSVSLFSFLHRLLDAALRRDERGQATAEYALVLLGAAAVALLVVTWAAKSGRVGRLLDAIFDELVSRVR